MLCNTSNILLCNITQRWGIQSSAIWHVAIQWCSVRVNDRWIKEYGVLVEWHWQGKTEVHGKNICPSVPLLSITGHIWSGLRSNLALHDERLATDYLSHGTADSFIFWSTTKIKAPPLFLCTQIYIFHKPLQCVPPGFGTITLQDKSGFSVEHKWNP
jgi:hypothetical protein